MHPGILQLANQVNRTIAANTNNYNAYIDAGSPTAASVVVVTINSGIVVGTTGSGVAFDTGAWPTGSTFRLINKGYIQGFGGPGDGGPGGDALKLQLPTTIDNTNGYIQGGGGGGAQGSSTVDCGGGGGGGGQGNPGGGGGARDTGPFYQGTDGAAGSTTAGGAGGTGGVFTTEYAAAGGAGGGFGDVGGQCGLTSTGVGHVAGGAAGKAVALNANAVTWAGGNNSTQVLGLVA